MNVNTKRREIPTPYPGIFKIQILDKKSGKWVEPPRGRTFKARRYVKRPGGSVREIKRSFETILEAKAFRNGTSVEKEVLKNLPARGGTTFGELVETWKQDWLPNKDISTQIRYKSYLKHFTFLWHMKVEEIEPTQIDKWIAHLKKPEYLAKGHTTRCCYDHEFSVLRVILNFYSSRFNRNYRLPFIRDHNQMLKVKNKAEIRKDLTVEQFRSFIAALKEICWGTKWEAIYYLALMQYGIYGRVQDAAALCFEDFDFVANKLEINKKVQWLRAKGFEDRIVPGSKSNGGKVLSPIPDLAARIFKEWILRSKIRTGPLFQLNGELITYRRIENKYTLALQKAGLAFTATHIIRHAALTEAYDSCKDLLLVQRVAGQRDLRSTTRYAKVRDGQLVVMQKQMDEKLSEVGRMEPEDHPSVVFLK